MRIFRRNRREKGNLVVEMGLIFLPMMLTLFGTFEVARGMWMYHTLESAIAAGTRYAAVHGENCTAANVSCAGTVGSIASAISRSAIGLDATQLQLTLGADGSVFTCASLAACSGDSTQWPPVDHNAAGLPVTIQGNYRFQSVLSTLWPGHMSASLTYVARAAEIIQF